MAKQLINYAEELPSVRIILIEAAEIYFYNNYSPNDLIIKNEGNFFDKHFKDLMPPSLDLIHLFEKEKLTLKKLGDEYYTNDFVNVVFDVKHPLKIGENNERTFKEEDTTETISVSEIRKSLYLNGFVLNGKKYIRYKRSAGSAKGGSCLFIKADLYPMMNNWSKAGLDESKDKDDCLNNLTSYEAYKALSLSSLIHTLKLKPENILFVDDFEHELKDQKVVKITCNENKHLEASSEICRVKNNIFDGEGLLDTSLFNGKFKDKGMMLLRNRYFKCCAFHTKLQDWFKDNNINAVNQLFGITFAKDIADIKLVVSKSCLKYVKLAKGGFTKENIKRWCDAVSDSDGYSTFGVVKTDKPTRFFKGDMVETTYQLLNTLELKGSDFRRLLKNYVDYIKKIRNIGATPEFIRFYLQGEIEPFEEYVDDSEDQPEDDELFKYSSYSFKTKICHELLRLNKDVLYTNLFKMHVFNDIISNFRLKLYGGRILVDGTYATLCGNPLEFLEYITIKDGKQMFSHENVHSSLGPGEISCSFFDDKKNNELVGSRAPHMTMGNVLLARNVRLYDVEKYFKLSRHIVVVDAINNNIQQRLNGADYDSDTMLLTNNPILLEAAGKHYHEFAVPYVAFGYKDKKLEELSKDAKENVALNLWKIDAYLANNKTGEIVNLSQKLNSHLWDNYRNRSFDTQELYNYIAILAVLAGAEIDSAKRSFDFTVSTELSRIRAYAKNKGYVDDPAFFFYVKRDENGSRPKIGEIETKVKELEDEGTGYFDTAMDILWRQAAISFEADRTKVIPFFDILNTNIKTGGLTGNDYTQIDKAITGLRRARETIKDEKYARKFSRNYAAEMRDFQATINKCYIEIRRGINNIRKTKTMIRKIENEEKTPYELIYLLLYIIGLNHKDLGYGLEDLIITKGGVPGLRQVFSKEKARYILFDKYYYQVDAYSKLIDSIFS